MILVIVLSSVFVEFIYTKKINYKLLLTTSVSLCPIIYWKYIFFTNNIKMEFLQYGDPIARILGRMTNAADLSNIAFFLLSNEKLLLSLIIFVYFAFRYFNKNKRLIFLITLIFLLYFTVLIFAILVSRNDLIFQLEMSTIRIFIPLVLMLIYFPIFLIRDNYSFK